MKIIRHLDSTNQPRYAAQNADGSARQIDGDIFSEFTVSDRVATVTKLLAPVVPRAILCIGLNYRKHAEETKAKIPEFPVLFMKNPAAAQNPGDPILIPTHLKSDEVDYEGELAVIIGKRCKNTSRKTALDSVLGADRSHLPRPDLARAIQDLQPHPARRPPTPGQTCSRHFQRDSY